MSDRLLYRQPLSGIRVLELSGRWTGFCGRLLCDLGAEVVLAEPPGGSVARRVGPFLSDQPGPDRSLSFWYENDGKPGITVDINIPSDRERIQQLVQSCDIVVESCAPGRLAEAGLDYEALRRVNPALIVASISGFGLTGPYSGYKSCGLAASAAGGQMYVCGLPGRQPLQPYGEQPYRLASLFAACGILLALRRRELAGEGQHIDISLQEAAAAALEHVMVQYFHDNVVARRLGSLQWNGAADLFPCRDGYILLTFNREWDTLVELLGNRDMAAELGQPAWKDEGYRRQHMDDIQEVLTFWTCQHGRDELFRLGQDMRFPWAPVGSIADVAQNAQLRSRHFFMPASHPLVKREFEAPRPVIAELCRGGFSNPPATGAPEGTSLQGDKDICRGGFLNPPENAGAPEGMPLQGIRVLDFTWMLAGPYATRLLADFGAEVIKVQSQQTATGAEDNQTGYFAAWNRNKLGITLNLSRPEARNIVIELAGKCDVVMENFTPRVMRNWGLDYTRLREANPKLVMVSLSGFGRGGLWENYAALGSTVQALSGLTGLTSYREGRPCGIGFALADHISGLYAALAALSALRRRDATGCGEHIEISELEAACSTLAPELIHLSLGGNAAGPQGNHPARQPAAPYGCYLCKGDDSWCAIAVHDEEEWRSLCRAVGDPAWTRQSKFADLSGRRENSGELDRLIGEWTRTQTKREVMRILQESGVPAAAVSDASDLAADPQLCERGFFIELQHPRLGVIRADGNPIRLSATPARFRSAAPLLGADNRRVFLNLLGMDEERFNALVAQGIIG
ncbi:MAG: CoA transferase [Dehalococcoidia bacterium]|jgi:crotonobetainyl-CoA:carnitine CoA-transferase CaiB-like acyl-CoA transferase